MLRLQTKVARSAALLRSPNLLTTVANDAAASPEIKVPCRFCGQEAVAKSKPNGHPIHSKVAAGAEGRETILRLARAEGGGAMHATEPADWTPTNSRCCSACSTRISKASMSPWVYLPP